MTAARLQYARKARRRAAAFPRPDPQTERRKQALPLARLRFRDGAECDSQHARSGDEIDSTSNDCRCICGSLRRAARGSFRRRRREHVHPAAHARDESRAAGRRFGSGLLVMCRVWRCGVIFLVGLGDLGFGVFALVRPVRQRARNRRRVRFLAGSSRPNRWVLPREQQEPQKRERALT